MTTSRLTDQLRSLELHLMQRSRMLHKIPLLRRLQRRVTARLTLLGEGVKAAQRFRVDFLTPFLKLPVEVERAQIGAERLDGSFEPAAFRFFDWQTWMCIEGAITWHGERELALDGKQTRLITGFTYQAARLPVEVQNLGVRVAEGVEGRLRLLWKNEIRALEFRPGYWMLEPREDGYRVVAIGDSDLMGLIVSLSEMGGARPEARARAIENLWEWVDGHWGRDAPRTAMTMLLGHVRDWGPLALQPLYPGLVQILERLDVDHQDELLFEFYADHWGIRDNPSGRRMVVSILQALDTDSSRAILHEMLPYVRNRGVAPVELAQIEAALDRRETR